MVLSGTGISGKENFLNCSIDQIFPWDLSTGGPPHDSKDPGGYISQKTLYSVSLLELYCVY